MDPHSQSIPQPEQVAAFFQKHRTGLVTLVFTDLVDSTALLQKLGDQAGASFLKQRRQIIRDKLRAIPEGEEIETAGDSFLLVFSKPSDAVRFALLVQAQLRSFSEASNLPVQERIGIHLGEVVIDEGETEGKAKDLYGIQLATASRIMSLAEGGQVLLTRGVFDSARQVLKGEDIPGIGQLSWVNHGPYLLKGVDEPVEVCEVAAEGQRKPEAPKTSEKAQRQIRPDEEPVLGWRPALGQEVPNTPWVLEEKLGEGGFGEVWRARHPKMREDRVFKFCFRADRVRTLKRELTLFKVLKEHVGEHSNVVRLYDVYLEEPPYYLEEEFVEGKDLKTWCEAQGGVEKVTLEVRLEIVAQAADALQAAHDAGIIHRDVKPGNILVSGEVGDPKSVRVKLTDFGIGQVTSAQVLAGVTQSGFTQTMLSSTSSQTGTHLYMAPELLAGRPASTRSDIYSLGVVLYQLLVGDLRSPLVQDWAVKIGSLILREDLQRCFAGNPSQRFASAAELARNIRDRARRERIRKRARQGKLAASVAGLLTLLAAALTYGLLEARKQRDWAEAHAYAGDMYQSQQKLREGRLGQASALLDRYRPGSGREHLRGFEWHYLEAAARGDFFAEDRSSADAVFRLALSPDNRTLVASRYGGAIELWNPVSLTRQSLLQTNEGRDVAFSRSGRLLATSRREGGVQLWEMDPLRRVGELVESAGPICLSFSPDERHLAAFLWGVGACVWDVETKEKVWQSKKLNNMGIHGGEVCFSPDGERLAVGDAAGRIYVVDWAGNRIVADFQAHTQSVMALGWSPDGRILASGSGYASDEIRLWDPSTGKALGTLAGHTSWISDLRFSSDGQQLISASGDLTIGVWNVTARQLEKKLRGHSGEVWSLAFSEREGWIISGGKDGMLAMWDLEEVRHQALQFESPPRTSFPSFVGEGGNVVLLDRDRAVAVWHPSDPQPPQVIAALGSNHTALAASRVGQLLACGSGDGVVRIWSLTSDRLVTDLVGDTGEIRHLSFSQDGRALMAGSRSGLVTIWIAPDWIRKFCETETNGITAAALSPTGHLLAVGSARGVVSWWDVRRIQRLEAAIGHRQPVAGLSFSPDGTLLASSSEDGTVALWDSRTRQKLHHWKGSYLAVHGAAFSRDGTRLATGLSGGEDVVRIWDVGTRRELITLKGRGMMFRWVSFRDDGRALLAGSGSETYVWQVPSLD